MIDVGYVDFADWEFVKGVDVEVNYFPDYEGGDIHRHGFIEVAYVAEGNGWHLLNGNLTRCAPGDIVIVDKDDAHMWMREFETPLSIYNLIFRPSFFDVTLGGREYFADAVSSFLLRSFDSGFYGRSVKLKVPDALLPRVKRIFEELLAEYTLHGMGFEEMIRALTIELLVMIFRSWPAPEKDPGERESRREADFTAVLDHISAHYNEKIKLKDLARLMFLSEKYFSALFEEQFGMTVTEYIQRLRVFRACALLDAGGMSVSGIAAECGYGDVRFFNRIFMRYVGKTPTAYRRRRIEAAGHTAAGAPPTGF